MKKQNVELMILNVSSNGEDAISMKIYKNGMVCRSGVGALPELGISGMSVFDNSKIFNELIEHVPDAILEKNVNHEERTPNGYLEYVLIFFGVSRNGNNGEGADWAETVGLRFRLDQNTHFRHQLLSFTEGLIMMAAELTNEWYFDIIMKAKYNMLSSALPKETIITCPKTDHAIDRDYENYINQMLESARGWQMSDFSKDKTYEQDGKKLTGAIYQGTSTFRINFDRIYESGDNQDGIRKWWKLW